MQMTLEINMTSKTHVWTNLLILLMNNRSVVPESKLSKYRVMVRDWTRCPVATLPHDLPRVSQGLWIGEPVDPEIMKIGLKFMDCFLNEQYKKAYNLIHQMYVRYEILKWTNSI